MYVIVYTADLIREEDVLILHEDGLNSIVELGVAYTRAIKAWEQVSNEPQEQRNILKHKLGQVHVSQGSH